MSEPRGIAGAIEAKRTKKKSFLDFYDDDGEEDDIKDDISSSIKASLEEYLHPEKFIKDFVNTWDQIVSSEYEFDSRNEQIKAAISKLNEFIRWMQSKVKNSIDKIYWKLARWVIFFYDNLEKLDINQVNEYYQIIAYLEVDEEYANSKIMKDIPMNIMAEYLQNPTKIECKVDIKEHLISPSLTIFQKLDSDISMHYKSLLKEESPSSTPIWLATMKATILKRQNVLIDIIKADLKNK